MTDAKPTGLSYVVVTPARNEARTIEATIHCMVKQTVLPLKWVIVSDGSTDGTDDIVKRYTACHPWIELLRMPERGERNFAGKVYAFNAGFEHVRHLDYDVIASLDADLSFDQDYFSFLVDKFAREPRLGVAGTPFVEDNRHYDYRFTSIEHVSGACQVFRRQCFEEMGGYKPIKSGGIDLGAVTTARMKNWHTRTFTEKAVIHHRKIGTATTSKLKSCFKFGEQDYYLGSHPLWELFRSLYQMTNKPYLLRGVLLLAGYSWATLTKMERPVPKQFVEFRRKEQMERLLRFFRSPLSRTRVCD